MYRARLYATLLLVFGLPAGLASASILHSYYEAPGSNEVPVAEYMNQQIDMIDKVVGSGLSKPEKIQRIHQIVTEVENYRRNHKFASGFEEYTADLRIKPYELLPTEKDLGQKTCLQAKDRVMLNYDPTVEDYNTNLAPLRNVLKVIDRICS